MNVRANSSPSAAGTLTANTPLATTIAVDSASFISASTTSGGSKDACVIQLTITACFCSPVVVPTT